MLPLIASLCLGSAVFLVMEVVSFNARQRTATLRRASTYGNLRVRSGHERLRFRERVVLPLTHKLARLALRVNPRVTVEQIRLRLLSAGMSNVSPTGFLAAKAGAAILFLALGLAIGSAFG